MKIELTKKQVETGIQACCQAYLRITNRRMHVKNPDRDKALVEQTNEILDLQVLLNAALRKG